MTDKKGVVHCPWCGKFMRIAYWLPVGWFYCAPCNATHCDISHYPPMPPPVGGEEVEPS